MHKSMKVINRLIENSAMLILSYVSFIPFFVFGFWSLLATKIRKYILHNLCLHFARQDGQDGKKQKENHATKVLAIFGPNT